MRREQIFGTINVFTAIYSYFLPETRHLSVEQMDVLFGAVDEHTRTSHINQELDVKGIAEHLEHHYADGKAA